MSNKEFWIRFASWTILSLIIPVVYIFTMTNLVNTVNKVSVWGLILIAIAVLFFIKLWGYMKQGLPYSMGIQVVSGIVKIILPLLALYGVVYIVRLKVNEILLAFRSIEIFLYVLIPCEIAAIPINPFPKWIYLNQDKVFIQRFNKAMKKGE